MKTFKLFENEEPTREFYKRKTPSKMTNTITSMNKWQWDNGQLHPKYPTSPRKLRNG